MTPNEEYQEQLLLKAIDDAEKALHIILMGVQDARDELKTLRAYYTSLMEARDNLRSGDYIVSMMEFKKIQEEIKAMREILRERNASFSQMKQYMQNKKREGDNLREHLNRFRISTRRGVILEFRRIDRWNRAGI